MGYNLEHQTWKKTVNNNANNILICIILGFAKAICISSISTIIDFYHILVAI